MFVLCVEVSNLRQGIGLFGMLIEKTYEWENTEFQYEYSAKQKKTIRGTLYDKKGGESSTD